MAKLKLIRTDLTKAEGGVWVDYVDDVKLCIASINSKSYREHKDRLLRPHLKKVRAKEITGEQVLEIIRPAVAHHLLKGWKNIQDDAGGDIPYSAQTALEFFKDPALADLYNFVLEVAGEVANYREELLEDASGN